MEDYQYLSYTIFPSNYPETRTSGYISGSMHDDLGNYLPNKYWLLDLSNIDLLNSDMKEHPLYPGNDNYRYSLHNKINIYIRIGDKWEEVFNGVSPFKSTPYLSEELNYQIRFENNKIILGLRFPKQSFDADNTHLLITLAQEYYMKGSYSDTENGSAAYSKIGGGHNIKFIDSELFSIGTTSDSPGYVLYNYSSLSEINKSGGIISLKRMGALFTILSDGEEDLESALNYTDSYTCGFTTESSDSFSWRGYYAAHNKTYNKWSFNFLSDRIISYGSLFWEYNAQSNEVYMDIQDAAYISTFSDNKQINIDGKYYACLGAAFIPVSSDGSLPITSDKPFNNEHYKYKPEFSEDNLPIKYMYSVRQYKDNHYFFIELPEKIKPNTRYIIKNKPGNSFFNNSLHSRSENTSPTVFKKEDVIIEEYDMNEPLPSEVTR